MPESAPTPQEDAHYERFSMLQKLAALAAAHSSKVAARLFAHKPYRVAKIAI
jgi:hypothetical protein